MMSREQIRAELVKLVQENAMLLSENRDQKKWLKDNVFNAAMFSKENVDLKAKIKLLEAKLAKCIEQRNRCLATQLIPVFNKELDEVNLKGQ